MVDLFTQRINKLEASFRLLLNSSPSFPDDIPKTTPKAGIYLFTDNNRHLYVGRSNDIPRRLRRHCSGGKTWKGASFAFRLARESTNNHKASYKSKGSREDLMSQPAFANAFFAAKARIRKMSVRFIEEKDPVQQALLEIYVADKLQTPHNDFDNH